MGWGRVGRAGREGGPKPQVEGVDWGCVGGDWGVKLSRLRTAIHTMKLSPQNSTVLVNRIFDTG